MALSMKILDMEYSNHYGEFAISKDDPSKNINNLRISLINEGINDAINISWNDCVDPDWKRNIIVKGVNTIPINAYDGQVMASSIAKNQYAVTPLFDSDIQENTLYCFRIFTEFANETDFYSGFKNVFFVYVYEDIAGFDISTVVPAEIVLQNSTHRFVTDAQIVQWTNASAPDLTNYYNKPEVDAKIGTAIAGIPPTNLSSYYTKTETDTQINNAINSIPDPDFSGYYNKTEVDNRISTAVSTVGAPDMSNYYTKSQVDTNIAASTFKIGSFMVDESNVGDGKVLMYNATLGKLVYITPATGGTSTGNDGVYDGGSF